MNTYLLKIRQKLDVYEDERIYQCCISTENIKEFLIAHLDNILEKESYIPKEKFDFTEIHHTDEYITLDFFCGVEWEDHVIIVGPIDYLI